MRGNGDSDNGAPCVSNDKLNLKKLTASYIHHSIIIIIINLSDLYIKLFGFLIFVFYNLINLDWTLFTTNPRVLDFSCTDVKTYFLAYEMWNE
jgi:hypothetical protein